MKTNLLSLFLCLVITTTYAQIPFNNLINWYDFASGQVLTDDANGNNFTAASNTYTPINDRFGAAPTDAISLNGDYLTTNSDIDFFATNFGDNFEITYSFWIRTNTDNSDIKTIIDDSTRDTSAGFDGNDIGYFIYLQNGLVKFTSRFEANEPSSNPILNYQGFSNFNLVNVADGEWHHIIVYFNSAHTSGVNRYSCAIYVDNIGKGNNDSFVGRFSKSPNTVGSITVGNRRVNPFTTTTNQFTEDIDDILVYNRGLTGTERQNIISDGNYCFVPDVSDFSISNENISTADVTITGSKTYDLAYHKTSEPFVNATILSNVSNASIVSLTGLDAFTDYEVYLREQCSITTDWSESNSFKTTRTVGLIYVDVDATGNNNGSSWANAFSSLTEAVNTALTGESIWIADGIYIPDATNRNVSYTIANDDIRVYGGFNGTETNLNQRDFSTNITVLSGDLLNNDDTNIDYINTLRNDNAFNILDINANNIILSGLTISGAHTNSNINGVSDGGAITLNFKNTDLTVENCIIENNVSILASAGIYARQQRRGTAPDSGFITITNSAFNNNLSRYGSAIYSFTDADYDLDLNIYNCIFNGNVAKDVNTSSKGFSGSAGWFRAIGAGSVMDVELINNVYVNNEDTGTSSGVNNFNRSTVTIGKTNGTFNLKTSNSIFWENSITGGATGRAITGGIDSFIGTIDVSNSIDERNFSDIATADKTNVINSNPLFSDIVNNDFTLMAASPALDSGNNSTVIALTDYIGNQRIFNNTVDMGAYEFGSTQPAIYTLTINIIGNGTVTPLSGKTFIANDTANLIASPDATWLLLDWSGDLVSTNASETLIMDSDKTITATFSQSNSPIFVDTDATGNNDGTSWTDAYTSLQTAVTNIGTPSFPSPIWVADGAYKAGTTSTATFKLNPKVEIYGGFSGIETEFSQRDFKTHVTILEGDISNDDIGITTNPATRDDNSHHIITVAGKNDVIIDGFTIQNGNANSNASTYQLGAAIYSEANAEGFTVRNCILKQNYARSGGASIFANFNDDTNLVIENNIFENNKGALGSGLYIVATAGTPTVSITVSNNLFNNNIAGNFFAFGGYAGSAMWIRAIANGSSITANIYNNTIYGGLDDGVNPAVVNETPIGVEQSSGATMITNYSNNVSWNNNGTNNGAVLNIANITSASIGTIQLNNNISEFAYSNIPTANVSNSIVGNPLFTDAINDDFTLMSGSPAIDLGDNIYVLGNIDLLGNPRIVNTTVDAGAFEFDSTLNTTDFISNDNNITLYPNPTNALLNIVMSSTLKIATIYNIQGQKIKESKSLQLDVSKLSEGMYIIKIEVENGSSISKRFVKQ